MPGPSLERTGRYAASTSVAISAADRSAQALGRKQKGGSAVSTELTALRELFRTAPFVAELGMELESIGSGECVTVLPITQRHLNQNGLIHAGVQATMADHTAGAAASTRIQSGCYVVTAEIKISYLRAAKGERLRCRSKVLKPGRQFSFVESEVFCTAAGKDILVAKASATMAVVTPQHA